VSTDFMKPAARRRASVNAGRLGVSGTVLCWSVLRPVPTKTLCPVRCAGIDEAATALTTRINRSTITDPLPTA
jgi:hypothetical protein